MDQTDVGLRSVVKALNDTVLGAIAPEDHLAREQLRLAASYVEFVRQRLHLIHARERYDLKHYAGLARQLLAIVPDGGVEGDALRANLAMAEPVVDDADALTGDVRAVAMELAHAVAGMVQAVHRSSPAVAANVDRAVIAASERKLIMERLWYEPIGFEPARLTGATLEECLR